MRPLLVIEDDAVTRRLLVDVLESGGHAVLAVGSAEEGLLAASRMTFALALIDLRLPDRDGVELIAELRTELPTVPIIVVSGVDEVFERVRALDSGADDYITKPFDSEELLARVRSQLRDQLAWSIEIESALTQRSAAVRALGSVRPTADLGATATAACAAAMELGSIDGAALLWFKRNGGVRVLATTGALTPTGLQGFATQSAALAVRAQAARGPWFEPLGWRGGVAACAAVNDGGRPTGVLMLASTDAVGRGSKHALAAALDLAAIASMLMATSVEMGGGAPRDHVIDLRDPGLWTEFQPVVDIAIDQVVGWEALTRFADGTRPDDRFAAAHRAGIGDELEVLAIEQACREARLLDAGFLALNVSPSVIVARSGDLGLLFANQPRPIVVELTEHDRVEDYAELRRALGDLQPATVSVDDAGTGFASLRHVMLLRPEYVKLDRSWISGIDEDAAKQAMVAGLVHFARLTGTALVAEGVETERELETVRGLGVDLAQGYLLGRPAPALAAPALP